MALPGIDVQLTSQAPVPNAQDPSAIPHVIGAAAKGPVNKSTRINSYTQLRNTFADGPGPEEVGELVGTGGFPVYFTRAATTTPGEVTGDVTRSGGEAVAKDVFGAILLPGADHNGDVIFHALQEGVTLTVVAGGAAAYAVAADTKDITLTVKNDTTGTQLVALALGAAAGLIAQPALSGTGNSGASVVGQTLAQRAFDKGTLVYTAKGPGCYLVPGADANGGVIYLAKVAGASVEQIVDGENTPLTVGRVGSKIVVHVATDAGGAEISTSAEVAQAVADEPLCAELATATATGNGTGIVAAIAETALDPVQIETLHPTTAAQALAISLTGHKVTVSGATAAVTANPTSTATQVLAKLADTGVVGSVNASTVLSAALLGDGAGLAGKLAAANLTWSSASGAVALSGDPADAYHVQMEVLRGGVVGTQPYPTIRWCVDYLAGESLTPNWTGVILVPANGVVQLKNSTIDTGLTATFTGTLEKGAVFGAWTAAPEASISSLGEALDAAIAERKYEWGFATSPHPVTHSQAAILNGKLEAAFAAGTRAVQGLWSVRDESPGETVEQYQAAVEADFLGFVTPRGRSSACAGAVLHASPYTYRQFRRPTVWAAAARKASTPIHENLGKVGSGPLRNVLHLFYDEGRNPGLLDARFIVPLTYPQRPGFFYLAGAPTLADEVAPDDQGYTLYEYSAIANQITRIAQLVALQYLNDSLPGIAKADTARGIVAGAIDTATKGTIESRASKAVDTFLFKRKSDGKASASSLPVGEQSVTVRQDNNFLQDRTIYMDIQWIPLGLAKRISITITTKIPG